MSAFSMSLNDVTLNNSKGRAFGIVSSPYRFQDTICVTLVLQATYYEPFFLAGGV